MNTSKSNIKTFLTGLLVGAAAGAIAGILFAPDKGSETRRKFAEKAKKFKDDLPDQIEALKTAIDQKLNDIKSTSKEV
ncbi:MAG: YtxH domain-containing protein [Bacteroidales bacterium]|nr:YtxH domain-containing protein [Bacteroidales bacterium]